ncbi:MAG: nucleolar complex-associated protein-domain-containing protein [Monoraphidium minutum]|nr:MAG: nucleolar complex-associated protein-domain-containing protein [Monoraphidium minutum]
MAPGQLQDAPLPGRGGGGSDSEASGSGGGSESEVEVDDEDIAFVAAHGRGIGFLHDLDAKALDRSVKDKQKATLAAAQKAADAAAAAARAAGGGGEDEAGGDEEAGVEEYERRPRAREEDRAAGAGKGLPIKTPDGRLVFSEAEGSARAKKLRAAAQQVAARVGGVLIEDTLDDEARAAKEARRAAKAAADAARDAAARAAREASAAAAKAAAAAAAGAPPALAALAAARSKDERRSIARQQMAAAAQQLLAAPEKFAPVGLRVLTEMARDADPQISRLAMLSCLAVFRDLLPDYKIRPPSEAELAVRASKEVQALRDHEAALLKAYQGYLKTLLAAAAAAPPRGGGSAGGGASGGKGVESALASARVAVRCLAGLLEARPGFNYATDALVPRMAVSDPEVGSAACGAISAILAPDSATRPGLEALQLAADLVRRRKCGAPARVVEALLVLKLREAAPPGPDGGRGPAAGLTPARVVEALLVLKLREAAPPGPGGKAPPKKARKRKKDQLERDLEEGEAGPDPHEQAALQSKMLEARN